jgi:hypothetical protein
MAALQFIFIDGSVNAIDAETRVVPARPVVTVMQVLISRACRCARPGDQLEMELSSPAGHKNPKVSPATDTDCFNRKSSLSTNQATVGSKSSTRMAA